MIERELNGKLYRNIRGNWYDSSYIKPSDVVVAQLDALTPVATPSAPPTTVAGPKTRVISTTGWGQEFKGLVEDDFQNGATGTHWRSRASLGGALALALRALTRRAFCSWAIYRRADVYVAEPHRLREEDKLSCAKFALELSPIDAVSGFYCEKSDKDMPGIWDWWRLLEALGDTRLQRELGEIMVKLQLHWRLEAYLGESPMPLVKVTPDAPLLWQTAADRKETIDWAEFVVRLRDWPRSQWLNLYLGQVRSKAEAIAAGASLAGTVAQEFAPLVRLYDACSGSS